MLGYLPGPGPLGQIHKRADAPPLESGEMQVPTLKVENVNACVSCYQTLDVPRPYGHFWV